MGLGIKGAVSFHGLMTADPIAMDPAKDPGKVTDPAPNSYGNKGFKLLVEHGASDGFVSPESIVNVKKELDKNAISWCWHEHGGALHSFTCPDDGTNPAVAYQEVADRRSTSAMKEFFADISPVAPDPAHVFKPKKGPAGKL